MPGPAAQSTAEPTDAAPATAGGGDAAKDCTGDACMSSGGSTEPTAESRYETSCDKLPRNGTPCACSTMLSRTAVALAMLLDLTKPSQRRSALLVGAVQQQRLRCLALISANGCGAPPCSNFCSVQGQRKNVACGPVAWPLTPLDTTRHPNPKPLCMHVLQASASRDTRGEQRVPGATDWTTGG